MFWLWYFQAQAQLPMSNQVKEQRSLNISWNSSSKLSAGLVMKSWSLKMSLLLFTVLISGSFFFPQLNSEWNVQIHLLEGQQSFSILYKPSFAGERQSYKLPIRIQQDVIVPGWDMCASPSQKWPSLNSSSECLAEFTCIKLVQHSFQKHLIHARI